MSSKLAIGSLVMALGVGGLAGSWATARSGRPPFGHVDPVAMFVSSAYGEAIGKQVSFLDGFVPVAKKVLPAVVNLASSKIVRSPDQGASSSFLADPVFKQLFGDEFSQHFRVPRQQREHSVGSGAHIAGTDAKTDVAVVKIDGKDLPVLTLGDSSKVQIGEFALAVGNPFGRRIALGRGTEFGRLRCASQAAG